MHWVCCRIVFTKRSNILRACIVETDVCLWWWLESQKVGSSIEFHTRDDRHLLVPKVGPGEPESVVLARHVYGVQLMQVVLLTTRPDSAIIYSCFFEKPLPKNLCYVPTNFFYIIITLSHITSQLSLTPTTKTCAYVCSTDFNWFFVQFMCGGDCDW